MGRPSLGKRSPPDKNQRLGRESSGSNGPVECGGKPPVTGFPGGLFSRPQARNCDAGDVPWKTGGNPVVVLLPFPQFFGCFQPSWLTQKTLGCLGALGALIAYFILGKHCRVVIYDRLQESNRVSSSFKLNGWSQGVTYQKGQSQLSTQWQDSKGPLLRKWSLPLFKFMQLLFLPKIGLNSKLVLPTVYKENVHLDMGTFGKPFNTATTILCRAFYRHQNSYTSHLAGTTWNSSILEATL